MSEPETEPGDFHLVSGSKFAEEMNDIALLLERFLFTEKAFYWLEVMSLIRKLAVARLALFRISSGAEVCSSSYFSPAAAYDFR